MKIKKEAEVEVYFQMPEKLKRELKILASREGRTIKEILNEQTAKYVKVHKEGNPQHLMTNFTENEDFTGFPAMGIDFLKKKSYIKKYLSKDGRLNHTGKELWGHVNQWLAELQKL